MNIPVRKCSDCPFQYKIEYGSHGNYEWACGQLPYPDNLMGKSAAVIPMKECPLRKEPITVKLEV